MVVFAFSSMSVSFLRCNPLYSLVNKALAESNSSEEYWFVLLKLLFALYVSWLFRRIVEFSSSFLFFAFCLDKLRVFDSSIPNSCCMADLLMCETCTMFFCCIAFSVLFSSFEFVAIWCDVTGFMSHDAFFLAMWWGPSCWCSGINGSSRFGGGVIFGFKFCSCSGLHNRVGYRGIGLIVGNLAGSGCNRDSRAGVDVGT